jgi:hypothetical protein
MAKPSLIRCSRLQPGFSPSGFIQGYVTEFMAQSTQPGAKPWEGGAAARGPALKGPDTRKPSTICLRGSEADADVPEMQPHP